MLTTSLRTIAGWAVAALMTVFAVIAGFSIGGFYLPSRSCCGRRCSCRGGSGAGETPSPVGSGGSSAP
ncbi:hypothetical protein [Microbacterium sp. NIBRBAC000506063]|uniref:hypothetical protein n=1 Tax=Microbacterium sp. NIBRBAC000506063 TaxID=2734618 RepID=UPI001BB58519|nr:hypothetical protein [Microbacterium sp. NIBRBAC000506063]QTV79010.1 hypothetical protein KAE78_07505 [Microbacterium sp. NIBRBAC000506063]